MKVDDIIKVMYPNMENLSEQEKLKARNDINFIASNMDEIESGLNGIHPNSQLAEMTKQEQIKRVMRVIKAEKYFEAFAPSNEELLPEDEFYQASIKLFLRKHAEKIEHKLENIHPDSKVGKMAEQEKIRYVVYDLKSDIYFEELYPDYSPIIAHHENPELYEKAERDRAILVLHTEAVDREYQAFGELEHLEHSKQELIRLSIDKVKSDLEKDKETENKPVEVGGLNAKEAELKALEEKRKEMEDQVKAIENTQSQNQGE